MDTARSVSRGEAGEADFVTRAGWAIRRAGERLDVSALFHREQLRQFRLVPDQMRRLGDYLERRQLRGVRLDAERTVVARPLLSVAIAAAIGWVAGRAIRS